MTQSLKPVKHRGGGGGGGRAEQLKETETEGEIESGVNMGAVMSPAAAHYSTERKSNNVWRI